jgi:hypothetical protein
VEEGTHRRASSTGNSRLRRVSSLPIEWLQIQKLLFTLVLRECTKHGYSHLWAGRERGRIGNVSDCISVYPGSEPRLHLEALQEYVNTMFLKLWSAEHKWSSGSAVVVLID